MCPFHLSFCWYVQGVLIFGLAWRIEWKCGGWMMFNP
jgi:hypothetical protein